ncbi:class I SAM-dependent methyltransferase [soil metagenome]
MPIADWYDTPLYYDIIFDADTEREADFLETIMQRHGKGKSKSTLRILEPACGSGRLITAMAKRGHEVHGFDLNANMLDYAESRLKQDKLSARLWLDRLENFKMPTTKLYDFAHCLVSTFKYVLEEAGTISHLQHVARSLRKGGLYVLGLHLTDYAAQRPEHERWLGERDGIHVICNTHTWPPNRKARTEDLRTRLKITRDGQTWIQETRWQFRTYSSAELKQLLQAVPEFECVACHDFNYDLAEERKIDDKQADLILVLRRR